MLLELYFCASRLLFITVQSTYTRLVDHKIQQSVMKYRVPTPTLYRNRMHAFHRVVRFYEIEITCEPETDKRLASVQVGQTEGDQG